MPLLVMDSTGAQQKLSTTQDSAGYLVGSTSITDPSTGAKAAVAAPQDQDANAMTGNGVQVVSTPMLFNGTTFDRERGNVDLGNILSATGVGGTYNGAPQTNYNGSGAIFGVSINLMPSGSAATLYIEGYDSVGDKWYNMATMNITSSENGAYTVIAIYPGLGATSPVAGGTSVNFPLPRVFRASCVVAGSGVAEVFVSANIIQ